MRNRCCCNCRHCIRIWDDKGNCTVTCEIDGHYIGYVECFEDWCRHWAKDKWQTEKGQPMSEEAIYKLHRYPSGELEEFEYVQELVRCKDCKHRPIKEDADGEDYGFNVIAPNEDERCPCLVEDGWYSWMPDDNFYCGYGERREP